MANTAPAFDRHEQGLAALNKLDAAASARLTEQFRDVAPDLTELIISFAYGEVWSRPGLTPETRQLLTIATLATAGGSDDLLRAHIGFALNLGVAPAEIVETIIQLAVYAGFPRALNAMSILKAELAQR